MSWKTIDFTHENYLKIFEFLKLNSGKIVTLEHFKEMAKEFGFGENYQNLKENDVIPIEFRRDWTCRFLMPDYYQPIVYGAMLEDLARRLDD